MSIVARSVTVRAPAKVNLQLGVGPLRDDGYHDVVSVFHAVGIYDDVTASDRGRGSGVTLSVEGASVRGVPTNEDNLAAQAALLLADYADVAPNVDLHIVKNIPVAGGMAGGSADAAATLVACDALWRTGLGKEEFDNLAGRLGADVAFALHGGTAVGTGKGEIITPALISGRFHWVFALSDRGMSTPAVYAQCDKLRGPSEPPIPAVSSELMSALRTGDPRLVGPALTNDLQRAAVSLRPELDMLLETGLSYGALGAVVSGSGPTCAFLAADREHALDIAVGLSGSGLCTDVRHAEGPAHGTRIVAAGTTGPVFSRSNGNGGAG